jgi:hypothetical protein
MNCDVTSNLSNLCRDNPDAINNHLSVRESLMKFIFIELPVTNQENNLTYSLQNANAEANCSTRASVHPTAQDVEATQFSIERAYEQHRYLTGNKGIEWTGSEEYNDINDKSKGETLTKTGAFHVLAENVHGQHEC